MGGWEDGVSWNLASPIPLFPCSCVWWEGVGANRFDQDKVRGTHLAFITTAVQWALAVLGAHLEPGSRAWFGLCRGLSG